MKKTIALISILLIAASIAAQEKKLYDPAANADKDIDVLIKKARKEKKFILIQGGGNWCSWCYEFVRFAKADPQIDSVIKAGFIWYHLNYSKENENKKTLARLAYPQRFGFPVLIILNEKGERIHTQSSEYLEDGKKSYDKSKVQTFLEMWSPAAFNPKLYEEKG